MSSLLLPYKGNWYKEVTVLSDKVRTRQKTMGCSNHMLTLQQGKRGFSVLSSIRE